MKRRRVVAARNRAGKSFVVSDGPSLREHAFQHIPGMVLAPLWTLEDVPALPYDGKDPMEERGSLVKGPGGATFQIVTFPPDSVMMSPDFDPQLAGEENLKAAPGIADRFEPDNPGMHTTPTVDFGVVLKGRVLLELDDHATTELNEGDTYVLHGARHAWRNPTSQPATIAVVMVGTRTG
jgi:hypothetical protein